MSEDGDQRSAELAREAVVPAVTPGPAHHLPSEQRAQRRRHDEHKNKDPQLGG